MDRPMAVELTADAPEQTRARYPDESGYVERDGVAVFYEVYGSGEPTVLLLPTWSIIHSRHWKMQIPYLARHCRVVTFDGRGNGRSDRPTETDAYARARVRRRRARRAGRDRHGARRRSSSLSLGAQRALLLAAEHPERVAARRLHRPGAAARRRPRRERAVYSWEDEREHRRGLGEVQPPLLARATTAASSSSSSRRCSPSRTRPSRSRTASAGALETTPRDAHRHRRVGRRCRTRRARASWPGRVRCPVLVIHGRRRRDPPARLAGSRSPSRPAATLVPLEGSGHGPHARDPVKVNLLLRDFVAPPRRPHALGARAGHAASARSTSPRRSGSATRSATSRSPTSCASCTPTSRSTGSRSIRSPRCSRRAASASTRRARTWRTSRATSRASRPSTTCTASRRSGGWTRSCSRTSWSSTTSSATSRTTSGSATRPGSSTTTCTRIRSRSAPPTSG